MKKIVCAFGVAAAAAVPALAMQQQSAPKQAPAVRAATMPGELHLYEATNFNGERYLIDSSRIQVRTDWNIRSIAVHPGERWQICARPRFRDPCIVLDRSVHDATLIGVEGQIGSARPAAEAPAQSD